MQKLSLVLMAALFSVLLACGGAAEPEIVTVKETVVVEKEVIKEVEVERVVEKEVIKEVEVERVREVVVPVTTDPNYGGTLRAVSQSSIANLDPLYVGSLRHYPYHSAHV